ncbi:unnamed protein product [Prunus armeniaca]
MAKLKHLISCKALTKPPKDQKPPPFTGGCVVFRDVIQEGITVGRLKLAEKPPLKIGRLTTEASTIRSKRVTREANQRPKATISAGLVMCSKCKCESELEVTLDRQSQPTPSFFYRIGTSYQQGPVSTPSKGGVRQKDYLRPAQRSRRMTEQPKKEIPIKMLGNDKPLSTIIVDQLWN